MKQGNTICSLYYSCEGSGVVLIGS